MEQRKGLSQQSSGKEAAEVSVFGYWELFRPEQDIVIVTIRNPRRGFQYAEAVMSTASTGKSSEGQPIWYTT